MDKYDLSGWLHYHVRETGCTILEYPIHCSIAVLGTLFLAYLLTLERKTSAD